MGGGGSDSPTSGRGGRRGLKKTKIEIIPMIDTMFFLLVFFILSSVGIVRLQGININLPKEAPPSDAVQPAPPKELIISIDKAGNEFVNARPVARGGSARPLLEAEILKLYGPNWNKDDVSVVISADPVVPHRQVVEAIDTSRGLGITKFAIATKAEDPAAAAAEGTAAVAPTP